MIRYWHQQVFSNDEWWDFEQMPDGRYRRVYGVRTFETGATRDVEDGKPDYEGFLSPLVIERFGRYMHAHREQADGNLRDSDNWQKGIPRNAYMKSAWRHFMDWWKAHRRGAPAEVLEDALCALLFNAQGYLHELLVARQALPGEAVVPVYRDQFEQHPCGVSQCLNTTSGVLCERHR